MKFMRQGKEIGPEKVETIFANVLSNMQVQVTMMRSILDDPETTTLKIAQYLEDRGYLLIETDDK